MSSSKPDLPANEHPDFPVVQAMMERRSVEMAVFMKDTLEHAGLPAFLDESPDTLRHTFMDRAAALAIDALSVGFDPLPQVMVKASIASTPDKRIVDAFVEYYGLEPGDIDPKEQKAELEVAGLPQSVVTGYTGLAGLDLSLVQVLGDVGSFGGTVQETKAEMFEDYDLYRTFVQRRFTPGQVMQGGLEAMTNLQPIPLMEHSFRNEAYYLQACPGFTASERRALEESHRAQRGDADFLTEYNRYSSALKYGAARALKAQVERLWGPRAMADLPIGTLGSWQLVVDNYLPFSE